MIKFPICVFEICILHIRLYVQYLNSVSSVNQFCKKHHIKEYILCYEKSCGGVWIDVYQVLIAIFLYSGGQSCIMILLKNAKKRSGFRMDLKYTTLLSSLISSLISAN